MSNSCCSSSANNFSYGRVHSGEGSAYQNARRKNSTRYKYLRLPPLTKGLKIDIVSLNTNYGVVWYSHEVTIAITKKGCASDCETALTYAAVLITDNNVSFVFDRAFMELCKGRYEGTISIGCNELPCKLDLTIGQQLCFGTPIAEQSVATDGVTPIVDALDITDPSCCTKCDTVKPCGCYDATQQNTMCGNSLPCTPEEIEFDFTVAEDKIAKLDEWLATLSMVDP